MSDPTSPTGREQSIIRMIEAYEQIVSQHDYENPRLRPLEHELAEEARYLLVRLDYLRGELHHAQRDRRRYMCEAYDFLHRLIAMEAVVAGFLLGNEGPARAEVRLYADQHAGRLYEPLQEALNA